jgi:hypothetical protein
MQISMQLFLGYFTLVYFSEPVMAQFTASIIASASNRVHD